MSYHIMSYHIIAYRFVSYRIISRHIMSYHTIPHNLLEYNKVPIKIKAHLYRMTQELLTNILKHSEASIIQVELEMIKNRLQLFVSDNGKGGKQAPVLRSVEERLHYLNGQIEIDIKEGKGTLVKLFIPLN